MRQTGKHCKRVLETPKLTHVNKTKEYINVLSKSKSAIPPLFIVPDVLSSASAKVKLFAKNSSSSSDLDESGISLPVFPPRTNLKLHNISVTPMSVKKVIINIYFSKLSDLCFPEEILTHCKPELSLVLPGFFNICLKESCFPDYWKVSSVILILKNAGERCIKKKCCLVCLLFVVGKVFEKRVNNRLVDHLEKCGLFLIYSMVSGLLKQLHIF